MTGHQQSQCSTNKQQFSMIIQRTWCKYFTWISSVNWRFVSSSSSCRWTNSLIASCSFFSRFI